MTARRARFLVSVFLAAAALHATPARPASTGWVGLASPNFLLAGDVRPNDLREVAVRLEQFRETLRRLLPDARLNGGIPTVVVAFATRKGYEPFQPLQAGKRLPVGGLFVGSQDLNYLTMSLEGQARGYPVIFHEYTHLVLRENLSYAPFWFHEGLSEYYSTFELADGGRRAYVGRAVDAHVIRLRRTGALIPLAELLDADRSSPVFSAEATRPLFYAQSWVLTHYLLIGNASRAGQLQAFLRLLSSHVPRAQAFRQAFAAEPQEIERELQAYVRRYTFRAERVTFEERIAVDADRMQPFGLTEAAVQARLGDLLLHMNRLGEAEARLRSAVALDNGLAAAHVSLGMLRMRQDRFDAGVAEFARAIALDPGSHAAHYIYGAELLRHWDVLSAAQRNAGRAALERAAQLRPDSVDTLAALGEAYLFSGTRLDEAQRLLERSVALAPWDDRHKLTLAQVYLRQRDIVKAREVLGHWSRVAKRSRCARAPGRCWPPPR